MELETLDELAEPDTLPRRSYTERTGGPGSVRIHSVAKPAAKTKADDERDNNNNSSGGEADDADLAFLLDESTSNGDMPCTYGCGFAGSNADQLKAHEESCEHFYMNPRSKSQREGEDGPRASKQGNGEESQATTAVVQDDADLMFLLSEGGDPTGGSGVLPGEDESSRLSGMGAQSMRSMRGSMEELRNGWRAESSEAEPDVLTTATATATAATVDTNTDDGGRNTHRKTTAADGQGKDGGGDHDQASYFFATAGATEGEGSDPGAAAASTQEAVQRSSVVSGTAASGEEDLHSSIQTPTTTSAPAELLVEADSEDENENAVDGGGGGGGGGGGYLDVKQHPSLGRNRHATPTTTTSTPPPSPAEEGDEQCIFCLQENARTYDGCNCAPAPAHLACIVDGAARMPVGPLGWTTCGACFKPYKNEVQLALARGLKVKVSGRAPGDRDRLAADTVLGAALLQQGHCTEAVDVFQSTVAAYHHAHGPAHPDALMAAGNLGAALSGLGSHTEAVQIFRETWSTMKMMI
eukprot:gene10635-33743_t